MCKEILSWSRRRCFEVGLLSITSGKPSLQYTFYCFCVKQEDFLQKQVQGRFPVPCSGSFDMSHVHPSGAKEGEKG